MFIIILAIALPILFAYKTGDFRVFSISGHGPVWKETAQLIVKNPVGYGIGTYKMLFQYLCSQKVKAQLPKKMKWGRAHNSWLQMPFEVGVFGFLLFLGWLSSIAIKVKDPVKQTGLIILATNMMTAFPERMVQSVLILLMFLAYCSQDEQFDGDTDYTVSTESFDNYLQDLKER